MRVIVFSRRQSIQFAAGIGGKNLLSSFGNKKEESNDESTFCERNQSGLIVLRL
jgi:hypothetical protein